MYRWIGGVAIGVFLLALWVGCGGGDDSSSTSGAQPVARVGDVSRVEFISGAEAICATYKQERLNAAENFQAEEAERSADEQQEADAKLSDYYLQSLAQELEELEKLEVPKGDAPKINRILRIMAREIEEGEDSDFQDLIAQDPFLPFEEAAKAYGIACFS